MLAGSAICAALHRTAPVGSSSRSAAASRSRTSRPLTPPAAELCAKSPWTAPGEAVLWSLRDFGDQNVPGVDPHPGGRGRLPHNAGQQLSRNDSRKSGLGSRWASQKTVLRALMAFTSIRSGSWWANGLLPPLPHARCQFAL